MSKQDIRFLKLLAPFRKSSQQRTNSNVWSIFWLSAGYLVFGGCKERSKSRHSKRQILMFWAYFSLRQDIWFLEVARSLPKDVTAKGKF